MSQQHQEELFHEDVDAALAYLIAALGAISGSAR